MLERAYVEIGNICNLRCSFCHKTKREPRQMTRAEFSSVLRALSGKCKYIYLHLLGEPLLHPELNELLTIAEDMGQRVCITTNGTLLSSRGQIITEHKGAVHKVSISLHAPEGNSDSVGDMRLENYLDTAIAFAKSCAEAGIYVVFRLWNLDSAEGLGKNENNGCIENRLKESFPEEWQKRPRGYRLAKNIFLEYDGLFTWPAESRAEPREAGFCHGLSQQIGILADGSVVPCCLDSDGDIILGNIFKESIEDILSSERARKMAEGFKRGAMIEPLCQSCTYSKRFGKMG